MNDINAQDLLDQRIRKHYESMPPSEKRLADLLLSFPGDITGYSATELCELAKTSKAAATRFFSRLGYKDFNEARRQSRQAQQWGAPGYQATRLNDDKVGLNDNEQLITNHLNREQANLQHTLDSIDLTTLRALVNAITHKKRVRIIGYRNNRFLAEYLHRQLTLLRNNVFLHPGANQAIAEELFDINEDDLLIVLAMRRRTPIIENILTLACEKSAPIALISDPTAAPFEKYASWKINCIVNSASTLDSYTSAMSILALIINSAFADSPTSQERLQAMEATHEKLGELSRL